MTEHTDVTWVDFDRTYAELPDEVDVPGTLLEIEHGGPDRRFTLTENDGHPRVERVLIGHVNEMNGVCDHCHGIQAGVRVIRYAVVWSE